MPKATQRTCLYSSHCFSSRRPVPRFPLPCRGGQPCLGRPGGHPQGEGAEARSTGPHQAQEVPPGLKASPLFLQGADRGLPVEGHTHLGACDWGGGLTQLGGDRAKPGPWGRVGSKVATGMLSLCNPPRALSPEILKLASSPLGTLSPAAGTMGSRSRASSAGDFQPWRPGACTCRM